MSVTSLNDAKSELYFSMLLLENNRLNPGQKHGDATKTVGEPGDLIITAGTLNMQIPVNEHVKIDIKGNRQDENRSSKRKDMKDFKEKAERMEKFNKEKAKEIAMQQQSKTNSHDVR